MHLFHNYSIWFSTGEKKEIRDHNHMDQILIGEVEIMERTCKKCGKKTQKKWVTYFK